MRNERAKLGPKVLIRKKPTEMSGREVLGRIFSGLSVKKWSAKKFIDLCDSVGIDTAQPTLSRLKSSFESRGQVESVDDHRAAKTVLDLHEKLILCGWIFERYDKNKAVNLDEVMEFCQSSFDANMSRSTAHNYVHSLGFKWKKCKKKKSGFRPSKHNLISQAIDFLISLARPMVPAQVASLDFTYLTHRTRSPHGYGPSGAEQPADSESITSYTNCILTLVWGDGVNRTPAMAFTNNPAFIKDRRGRGIPKDSEKKRKSAFSEFAIDEGRVVYMEGKKTKSGNAPHYAYETLEMVEAFFESFEKTIFSSGKFIFSDEAKMFSSLDRGYFSKYGFEKWIKYPPAVHHYFSPNDNGLHGPAKSRWRKCPIDKSDDLRSTCYFLQSLDGCTPFVKDAFEDNLQLSGSYPSKESMRRLVFGKHFKKYSFYHNCLHDYKLWSGGDTKVELYYVPKQLSDSLDGAYYIKL